LSRETELRNLALSLVDEFYENQGQGILNSLNKRTYGNLSSDREAVLASIGESLSEYQDEDGNEMTAEEKAAALSFVKKEIWGYGLIDDLIHDKTISDIKIHDAGHIRIKREGRRETSNLAFPSEAAYQSFITRLLERNKVNLGTANAIQTFTDAEQEDFILRLAVISGLLIVGGSPCVVIRKIPKNKYSLQELEQMGMFTEQSSQQDDGEKIMDPYISVEHLQFDLLLHRMIRGKGILFTGKGASGKTTLMNACLEKIPETDSVMICQENAELFDLHHPDLIAAHVMINGGDSKVSYNLGDLTRVALLVDLDRVIVGEVKEGSEAAGLSKASMTGHKCWTSVHGESCEMAVEKMADYISQATGYGNREALKQLLGFEYVVHLRDFRVDEVVRIADFDHEKGKLILEKVYPFTKGEP
jgi:pilus assembly protein CpaF